MVHYGEQQIYWECKSAFLSEDGSATDCGTSTLHHAKENLASMEFHTLPTSPGQAWRKTVMEYTAMKLTYESDRLAAVAAVVERELRLRPGDTYIAGMWKSALRDDLTWSTNGVIHDTPRSPVVAPTWSWVASQVAAAWKDDQPLVALRVNDVAFTPIGPTHLGQVTKASIRLEGPILAATLLPELSGNPEAYRFYERIRLSNTSPYFDHIKVGFGTAPDFDYSLGERPVKPGDHLKIIMCASNGFSSLGGIMCRQATGNEYERIGYMEILPKKFVGKNETEEKKEAARVCMDEFVASLPVEEVVLV
jgi:hypothetical protein